MLSPAVTCPVHLLLCVPDVVAETESCCARSSVCHSGWARAQASPGGVEVGKEGVGLVWTKEQAFITVFELTQQPSDDVLPSSKETLNWLGLNRIPFYYPRLASISRSIASLER